MSSAPEPSPVVAENLLTYADLLQLEWAFADKIEEWIWRNDGETDDSIEKSRATLGRIREMIRLDELSDQKDAAQPVKLAVEITDETLRDAGRLARERCLQSLGETLAELAHDMAEAFDRPGSWEAERVHAWLDSHYPSEETLLEMRKGGGQ